MQKDLGRSIGYSFTNDSGCSYLVLELKENTNPLNHQVEIISQNPNPAFVPFHIRRENELVSIYYNITSKISLSEYLERKQLSKKELLDLFRSISKALLLHSNYLLELSGFMLEKDFIFINPATAAASLVYIPVTCDMDAIEAYKSFLKDLIVNSACVDDNSKDNYLQRILSCLKSEAFSLRDFDRLIMELRNSGVTNREKTLSEDAAVIVMPDAGMLTCPPIVKNAGNKKILNIVLVQVLIALAAAIACLVMVSQSMADMMSIIGILVIAGALDMLIIKKIGGKQEKQVNKIEPEQNTHKGSCRTTTKSPEVWKNCNTIIISEVPDQNYPYLEGIGVRMGERILINKDKFVIGRLGSMVDYIMQESTIGKLHAEITTNGGVYFIRDLNSKNGTYINDVRIPSNKEFEIKSNDRIRFSNLEYVFRQKRIL